MPRYARLGRERVVANGQGNRLEVACESAGCVHSPRVRCLEFEWSILTNDQGLADSVISLYAACVD
jgi:hypothetical protein